MRKAQDREGPLQGKNGGEKTENMFAGKIEEFDSAKLWLDKRRNADQSGGMDHRILGGKRRGLT